MSDDPTPTNPQPIDVIEAQFEGFRTDPTDLDLFLELRTTLRKAGQPGKLAEVCELRAPVEKDAVRAAAIWAEAGEARYHVGDADRGEQDLRRALALDPASERAVARMTEELLVAHRFAEAADIMEAELAALIAKAGGGGEGTNGNSAGSAGHSTGQSTGKMYAGRRANRHRVLGQLWDVSLGRVDRALSHWQTAWQIEPERPEAIEAARAIYASLGDDRMVAKLYELELEAIGERAPRDRRSRLEYELGRLVARRGDVNGAVARFERAIRLTPDDRAVKQALAEAYAAGQWPTDEPLERTVDLYLDLARQHEADGHAEEAISYLRRALGTNPRSEAAARALEAALVKAERWDELDRLYKQRAEFAVDDAEVAELLAKRAAILQDKLGQKEAAKRCLEALVAPQHGAGRGPIVADATNALEKLYAADGDWAEYVALVERSLDTPGLPEQVRTATLLELATIARDHLSDRDRAAEFLHRVLSLAPNHPEGLARYADHFREKRDWRGLADLAEFSVEAAREAGLPNEEVIRRLEDLAQVSELRLGDVERAIAAWRRVEEIDPASSKAKEAVRRLLSRAKMWESLVAVLEKEAAAAPGPRERADALKRIAQVFRERQVDPRRAIALYEDALGLSPGDAPALKSLAELYEREGDDAGLARTLRRQLEADAERVHADAQKDGKRLPTAREWPTAMRVERLTMLRRLATMYEGRLGDVEGVVYACTAILELLPGDRDALDRLERTLDKHGDLERLEQTLEYHAEAATGPAERAKVLRRLARIAQDREDDVAAVERWERVMRAAPNDGDALTALGTLYEKIGRWAELAVVLERSLIAQKAPEPGSAAAAARAWELRRYARVVDGKLGDPGRAVKAWQRVMEILPRDREALEALARLHQARGEWRELADVLKRQAPLYAADDRPDQRKLATGAALERARLLEERLGQPKEAAEALEALIKDVDPACVEAHGALRRLYEARGDFEAAVRVAEREMYLATDASVKTARGLEIGLLCRDRLQDPRRALQAYERVLALEPDHGEALLAASELYARVGDWRRHVGALTKLSDRAPEGRERRTLYLRIAQAVGERLGDAEDSFGWYRRAHEHLPDATTLDELRRAAETHGLWQDLAEVFDDERRRVKTIPAAFVAACRELAAISVRHLQDRKRAIAVLRDAVETTPEDDTLVADAERIATEAADREAWTMLLGLYQTALDRRRDAAARVALHERRARVYDERLEDPKHALDELLRAFALIPERELTREGILRLAERTRRWEDAVAVEAALYLRATTPAERIAISRRAAQIIEERLSDRVRAFRTYLRAFFFAPEDQDVTAHLWRLARAIGPYRDADKLAKAEPPPAHVDTGTSSSPPPPPLPVAGGSKPPAPPPPPLRVEQSRPQGKKDSTQEISIGDLILDARKGEPRVDQTIQLSAADLMPGATQAVRTGDVAASTTAQQRPDQTIELKTEDLVASLRPPPAPGARGKLPPPMPARLPGVHAPAKPPAPPAGAAAAKRGAIPAAPTPSVPARKYDSPWDELAAAYEALPHAPGDRAGQLRNLFRAAEVWERGAKDIPRALDTLYRGLLLVPGDAELRGRLMQLAADHDAWDRLADLYDGAAEKARSADEAATLLAEVAEIRTRQGKPRDSEAIYRQILGMRPEDIGTREKLEALYRSEGRWVDLAASLEERTDPRLGAVVPDEQRVILLRELAVLYDDKLAKPYEAIASLDRLCALQPDDADALEQSAAMYGKVGRWAKVVETLGRVAEIAEATPRAREARRQIAVIYEKELELPDRAIEAYALVISGWPEDAGAFEALDRLYEQTARWSDLAEVLRRRAALAQDPQTRVLMLRRRAKVLLEWLNLADEAVACLRHARTITPEDGTLSDEMVTALSKSGRAREAAAVLEGRIATLEQLAGAPGDVAAQLLKLAALRADALDDQAGARRVLEQVLLKVPDHPSALAALARLARGSADPRAYADALLREASAAVDVGAKVTALLAAGATLRDALNETQAARDAFEKVLALEPANADAVWALSALVAGHGELDLAAQLLEQRLAGELSVDERARALTELAAIAQKAGVAQAAERRLGEALEVKPDHLPAILLKADLMTAAGKDEELEAFLRDALPRVEAAPGSARAELERRLAACYDRLGRDDDAYAQLLEADKLHRNDLLTKLALGENRYRARRWREAALHLAGLAEHPEAKTRAAEVADGLYHAALAEIRSLRPERAVPLYEAALILKPDHAMALHALAEIEIERGNVARAADLLERQAAATADHAERLRLFEALGDLALVALEDGKRARLCFEAAVAAASPLEKSHMPLLDKLLGRQRADGDQLAAARTSELMASFGADAATRAARLHDAAEAYLAGGDRKKARAAAERAVESDPFDEAAIWLASELLLADGDAETAASLLGRAMSALPPASEAHTPRRAELWRRLGDARKSRGDIRGAIPAYERSVQLDAESDAAIAARRALVELLSGDAEQTDAVRGHLRALADVEQRPREVLLLARALCRQTAAGPVDEDGGRATLELAAALGEILEDSDRAYLAKYPARVLAADEAYGGALDDDDRQALIADADDAPLGEIMSALWEAAPGLWPDVVAAVDLIGVIGAERVPPTAEGAAPAIYPQVVKALGAPATVLWGSRADITPDVTLACCTPPLVILGPRLLAGASSSDHARDAEVRFLLGRAVEMARPERIPACGLPAATFAALVAGAARAYGGAKFASWLPAGEGVEASDADAEAERLRKLLTFKVRSKIEATLAAAAPDSLAPARYRAACQRAGDRAGLIVSGDVVTAIRVAGGPKAARHLVRLAVRERYLMVRAKIGIGAR